ncbi:MAG: F0F1 ATP synthase subunit B [Bacilli bacterium]|nr:F0F1 ATP synthase subunit B [Bacilli bacterium]
MVLKILSNMDNIGETMKSIADKLIPNWLSFVIQFSSFIILLLVVFFFAYKPVKKMLKKRADFIQEEIDQAQKNHAEAVEQTKEAKRLLSDSKAEASLIIENATKKGEEKYEAMMLEAKEEVKEMKLAAQEDIEQAKVDALNDIRNEMVNVALTASKEILKREVDEKDNTRLAEDFINRLN